MAKKRLTVAQLAAEGELDLDEALITLWDAGIDGISNGSSLIPTRLAKKARRAIGLQPKSDLQSPEYWREKLQLGEEEFLGLLGRLRIPVRANARRLPRGAVAKLRTYAKKNGLSSETPERTDQIDSASTLSPVDWDLPGHSRDTRYLSSSEILSIHEALVIDFGDSPDPIEPPGLHGPRGADRLESSCSRPQTSLGNERKYATVEMAAAALTHSLVLNHPFRNGNKRTALVAMLVMLDANGIQVTATEDQLFEFILRVAQHSVLRRHELVTPDGEVVRMAEWLCQHSRQIQKGDRPIPWHKLKAILRGFGCEFTQPKRGNRINIIRRFTDRQPGRFLSKMTKKVQVELTTQVHYSGEGQEVARNAINKIRKDLRLTEDDFIDSSRFYYDEPTTASEFVLKYQKLLNRLSKL